MDIYSDVYTTKGELGDLAKGATTPDALIPQEEVIPSDSAWDSAYQKIAKSRPDLLQGIGSGLDLSRDASRYDQLVTDNPDLGLQTSQEILNSESLDEQSGFVENVKASFSDAYKRAGMGAAQGKLGPQWEDAYQKIYKANPKLLSDGIGSQLDLARNPDKYDEIVKNNPQLGLSTSDELRQMDINRLKQEAAKEKEVLDNASTSGKVGQILGALAGYSTHPIAVATLPLGGQALTLRAGEAILPQLPRILAANTAVAAAVVAPTKPSDVKYRREILGEEVSTGQAAKEIVFETAVGGFLGAGLSVGIGAIARSYNAQALQLGKVADELIPEALIAKAEKLEAKIESQGGEATKKQADELNELQQEIIDKTGLPIRQNVKEGGLLPIEEQELATLQKASKEGTLAPEQQDRLQELLDQQNNISYAPTEAAIKADGTPLSPDELTNNPFTANHLKEMTELEFKEDFGQLSTQEADRLEQLRELYDVASQRLPGETQIQAANRYADTRVKLESGADEVDLEIAKATGENVNSKVREMPNLENEAITLEIKDNLDLNEISVEDLKAYEELRAEIINDSKYDTMSIDLEDGTQVNVKQLAQEAADEQSALDKIMTCMLQDAQKPKINKGE
jgi:hypothetical protein